MSIIGYVRGPVNVNLWTTFLYIVLLFFLVSIIFRWLATSSPPHVENINGQLGVSLSATTSASTSLSSTSSSLPCDEECLRFRRLLEAWPADKPKAAVVLLLRPSSINTFARSSHLFSANFNDAYNYPVIVFHEENMNNKAHRQRLRSLTNSSLYFQVVHFDMPSFINQSAVPKHICFKPIGYRHMCRFQAKTLYEQPILAGLQYVWRLDDDSYITCPVGYDVFRLMRDRHIQYGFARVVSDYGPCIVGLWPAVTDYMRQRAITPKFRWPRGRIFWNNFEISDLDVWRSPEYRDYIDYIDRTGGIYYRRWGDATIKTIAVTLFVPKDRTYHFKDIAYKHGRGLKLYRQCEVQPAHTSEPSV